MDFKRHIIKAEGLSENDIYAMIELPPNTEMGDFALPCFRLAKTMRKAPALIAQQIAADYQTDEIVGEVSAVNGYVNFKIDRALWAKQTLEAVLSAREKYGSGEDGKGKTVCIDYSSVNIAKPFHIGHLSTTVLGSALYKLHKFLGYTPVGINHLGDYGTQRAQRAVCALPRGGGKRPFPRRRGARLLQENRG